MDTTVVLAQSDHLVRAGDEAVAAGRPGEVTLSDVPEDRHGLRDAVVAFEAARADFDRRFGEGLQDAGARLAGVALAVLAADGSPFSVAVPLAATAAPERGR